MPVHSGKDSTGCYYQWGGHGAKYHYECGNEEAASRAKAKAGKQGQAAHAHGYKGYIPEEGTLNYFIYLNRINDTNDTDNTDT